MISRKIVRTFREGKIMKKDRTRSYLMLIASMTVFGTVGIFRRYIPLSSAMLAFSRGILGGLFLLLIVWVSHHKFERISRKCFLVLVLSGALMGINWITLFEAYNYTTVATATMCYYMQPTIVLLLSPLVFREKLTAKKLVCAAVSVVGMLFVSGMLEGNAVGSEDFKGVLYGLSSAVFYAAVVIISKKVPLEDAYAKTVIQLFSAAIVLIPYLLLTESAETLQIGGTGLWMLLIVCIVHTGIAYAAYFSSVKTLKAQSVAVLSYIDPVCALLLSALFLHERLTLLGLLGAALILASALVSELGEKRAE